MGARPVIALVCMTGETGAGLGDYLERRGYEVRETAEDWAAESLLAAPDIDVAVIGEGLPASLGLDLLQAACRRRRPELRHGVAQRPT